MGFITNYNTNEKGTFVSRMKSKLEKGVRVATCAGLLTGGIVGKVLAQTINPELKQPVVVTYPLGKTGTKYIEVKKDEIKNLIYLATEADPQDSVKMGFYGTNDSIPFVSRDPNGNITGWADSTTNAVSQDEIGCTRAMDHSDYAQSQGLPESEVAFVDNGQGEERTSQSGLVYVTPENPKPKKKNLLEKPPRNIEPQIPISPIPIVPEEKAPEGYIIVGGGVKSTEKNVVPYASTGFGTGKAYIQQDIALINTGGAYDQLIGLYFGIQPFENIPVDLKFGVSNVPNGHRSKRHMGAEVGLRANLGKGVYIGGSLIPGQTVDDNGPDSYGIKPSINIGYKGEF